MTAQDRYEEHTHEAMVHDHPHHHVTHNFNRLTGGFDHLSSEHSHDHDHASVTHGHHPHEDFEQEHQGEAHIHDHAVPVRDDVATNGDGAAKKAPAKKATAAKKTTKKASVAA